MTKKQYKTEMYKDCLKVLNGNDGFRPSRKYCNHNCNEVNCIRHPKNKNRGQNEKRNN